MNIEDLIFQQKLLASDDYDARNRNRSPIAVNESLSLDANP